MDTGTKVFAMSLNSLNTSFIMYHYNSYANVPVMLRSNKPLIMRDIFLTKCTAFVPNPFSAVYVTTWYDCFGGCFIHWLCCAPVIQQIGCKQGLIVYFGAGMMSNFAYLFQNQVNRDKRSTKYDCNCSSNGATIGLAMLSLMLPKCYIPLSKKTPAAPLAIAWFAKSLYEEYLAPRRKVAGEVQVTNWGSVGGVFFAFMYGSLVLRTRGDFRAMGKFWSNVTSKK